MGKLSALDSVLGYAAQVRLTEATAFQEDSAGSGVVVDLSRPGELGGLRTAMAVGSLPGSVCMCSGDVQLEFLDARGLFLTAAFLHHGVTLRWDGWDGDAVLVDGRSLLRWLDLHGVPGPLRQFEEDELRYQRAKEEESWLAAMPPTLSEFSEAMLRLSRTGGSASPQLLAAARDRLRQSVPDPMNRALLLLAWCGANSGLCSGFPSHEAVPGLLLGDVPMAEIIAGLQDPRADARHDAGRSVTSSAGRADPSRSRTWTPFPHRSEPASCKGPGHRATRTSRPGRNTGWHDPSRAGALPSPPKARGAVPVGGPEASR
ncbi:hypothetical protein ACF07T_26685 [Streptomyces sp. NPDC015184]|uniref:hypothetical protein n=1 Tax=Streptomyces sp. NPDC015184 TaxID=3364946 RepID=UPI0036FF017D